VKTFYTMVDSTLGTPQPEQLTLCRNKAHKEGGEVVFYGAEEIQCIHTQPFIVSKLKKTPGITDVVFFAFAQFCYGDKLNIKVLKNIINDGYGVHFAREDLSFYTEKAMENSFPLLSAYYHTFQRRLNKSPAYIDEN
jgi:hypothetical protein